MLTSLADDLISRVDSVFIEFAKHQTSFGNVDKLATPVFFYGMHVGQEIAVELERGKTILIRYAALGEPDDTGHRTVYFELNGQPRNIAILDKHTTGIRPPPRKAEPGNFLHLGAPMPGQIVKINIAEGLAVHKGDPLLTIEAMKMQTIIHASHDGTVRAVLSPMGARVSAGDLLVEFAPV